MRRTQRKRKRARPRRVIDCLACVPEDSEIDALFLAAFYAWYALEEADDESAEGHWCLSQIESLNELIFRCDNDKLQEQFRMVIRLGTKAKWPRKVLAALQRDRK